MRGITPSRGPWCEWHRAVSFGFFFLCFSASFARAQDVAEAARQARARKAAQQESPRHVYTEADLQRKNILTPEDQAKVEARKHPPANPPAGQSAESLPIDPSPQTESLGEIARRYRQAKEARDAEQSAKKNLAPFHYELPATTLATPKPEAVRKLDPSPSLNPPVRITPNPLPDSLRPLPRAGKPARISPFQPRPLVSAPHALPNSFAKSLPLASPRIDRRTLPASPSVELKPLTNRSPLPSPIGLRPLHVQRGESWWKLAEHYLGSGARWPELRRLNPGINGPPESLLLGSIVLVPGKTDVRASPPARTITVKKGDSLWTLAREHFGHASQWTRLARANPQISDYTRLAIGTRLQVPPPVALVSSPVENSNKLHP